MTAGTRALLTARADSMRGDPDYRAHAESVLAQLGVENALDAFIVGAVDAMIYDASMKVDPDTGERTPRGPIRHEQRARLLEEMFGGEMGFWY